MRISTIVFLWFSFCSGVFAQTPEKFSYQAIVRSNDGQLVTDTQVGVRISILQGTISGSAVYVETHTPTTNANGLMYIEIGGGIVVSGNMANVNWAADEYFVQIDTDLEGGTNYTISGTSQLLSVPYALHAKTAEEVTGVLDETDPVFGNSAAKNITLADLTNWNNKQAQLTAGQGISINDNTIQATRNPVMLYGSGAGGTINTRNTYVNTTVSIPITETGEYLVFYKMTFYNLLGNTTTLPSDRSIEVQLIQNNGGTVTVVDAINFSADREVLPSGAVAWNFRPDEHLSDVTTNFFPEGSTVSIRFRIIDNGIAPTPTYNYTYGNVKVYAVKVN
jgi:hypothetical protein